MFVSLDGVALEIEGTQPWVLTPGVSPHSSVFEVDRSTAMVLFDAGGSGSPVMAGGSKTSTLLMRALDEERLFTGLSILGLSPSSNLNTVKLQLVDQRAFWPYKAISRRYNKRRKSTSSRRVTAAAQGDVSIETSQALRVVNDDVVYATYSLNRGKAWTGADIIRDVMDRVVGAGLWDEQDSVLGGEFPEIEDLQIVAQGDTAISQALSAVGGGVGVYVQSSGRPAVYAIQDGGEFAEVGLGGSGERPAGAGHVGTFPLIFDEPLMEIQDNRRKRPRHVRVYFERLIEGRVDFAEGSDLSGGLRQGYVQTMERGTGAVDPIVPVTAYNVFPMPEDGTIPGVGDRSARKVVRGTWVTFEDLLGFFRNDPAGNALATQRPITSTLVRKLWFSNALEIYASPVYDKGGTWAARVAILREHYRRTYRINRPWIDRIARIETYRVAIEDPESGARAPSPVYQDYTQVYAWNPIPTGNAASEDERNLVRPRSANPKAPNGGTIVDTAIGTGDSALRPAPALISIVDQDQGIVQVSFRTDFSGIVDRYVHSATEGLDRARSAFGGRFILLGDEALSSGHEVSMVLTFDMASPNDKRRFYGIDVKLSDAEKLLPRLDSASREGTGPVLEVFVGAPRAKARIAWDDDRAEEFYKTFAGITGEEPAVQPDLGDPINLDELTTYAQGIAAKEFARFRDHPEGALVTTFRGGATIRGTVSAVRHEFSGDPNGGALTTIELAPEPPALDTKAVMPKDVRRVIEGFVDK